MSDSSVLGRDGGDGEQGRAGHGVEGEDDGQLAPRVATRAVAERRLGQQVVGQHDRDEDERLRDHRDRRVATRARRR